MPSVPHEPLDGTPLSIYILQVLMARQGESTFVLKGYDVED